MKKWSVCVCVYIYRFFFNVHSFELYFRYQRAKMSPVFSGYQQVTEFSFITEMCGLKTVLPLKKLIQM